MLILHSQNCISRLKINHEFQTPDFSFTPEGQGFDCLVHSSIINVWNRARHMVCILYIFVEEMTNESSVSPLAHNLLSIHDTFIVDHPISYPWDTNL